MQLALVLVLVLPLLDLPESGRVVHHSLQGYGLPQSSFCAWFRLYHQLLCVVVEGLCDIPSNDKSTCSGRQTKYPLVSQRLSKEVVHAR